MKTILLTAVLSLSFGWSASNALAAKKADVSKKKTKISRNVSFEDLLVQGKYHFSDEAVTTVEEDKVLDALLGIRKDFRDRLKRSASRN